MTISKTTENLMAAVPGGDILYRLVTAGSAVSILAVMLTVYMQVTPLIEQIEENEATIGKIMQWQDVHVKRPHRGVATMLQDSLTIADLTVVLTELENCIPGFESKVVLQGIVLSRAVNRRVNLGEPSQ